MKIELYINGSFYESVAIPRLEGKGNFCKKVELAEENVDAHIFNLKAMFFRQINRAQSFEIYLVAQSAINRRKRKKNTCSHIQT